MQIQTILSQIDLGAMALPEFQRGYVWNREQVRGLMYSLYRRHPVGGLLFWGADRYQSPTGFWYVPPEHEWVVVLKGAARFAFEGGALEMTPDDCFDIPTRDKHSVTRTTLDEPTI